MTKTESLHQQIRPRFVEYLKAAGLQYMEPALTACPHCGRNADILMGSRWSCRHCEKYGDVVDYVMAHDHLNSETDAIKKICRTLQIKITSLDVISADELMDKQFESIGYLIDGFMGRGVYLLAGSPKIGKSWLVLWLAHRISLGEDIWGFKTRQCGVLYISLEDPERRVQSRVAEVTRGETGDLWFATEAELIGKGFEEQIAGFLTEHPDVRFIIVDTLQKIRQVRSDQYSYSRDYEVISMMKSLADRFNITILLVHHTRKAGAADPFSMISGTTGLSGGVDGSLVMIKDERMDNHAKLFVTGRDTPDMELELRFDPNTTTWQLIGCGDKKPTQKRDDLLVSINDLINDTEQFHGTASELIEQLSKYAELDIKSPSALTRLLNPNKALLEFEYGILYEVDRNKKERRIHLTRITGDDDDGIMTTVTLASLPSPS